MMTTPLNRSDAAKRGWEKRKKMNAYDKQMAAIHEAAHFVVARYFKRHDVTAEIHPNPNGGSMMRKAWIGQTNYKLMPSGRIKAVPKLPRHYKQMVGCAGVVAEAIYYCKTNPDPDGDDYIYIPDLLSGEPDAMSPTDWGDTTPGDLTPSLERSAEAVLELLRRPEIWAEVEAGAEVLVEDGSLPSPKHPMGSMLGLTPPPKSLIRFEARRKAAAAASDTAEDFDRGRESR
jgi:hypothetical protein